MIATDIRWDVDDPKELEELPEEIAIPRNISPYVRRMSEIEPNYDFLMSHEYGIPKKWWYGIEGIYFIFMGVWSDPYIGYKEYAVNSHCVEDAMWDRYNEEYPAPDYRSEEYKKYSEEGFTRYMREHKDEVFEMLDEIIEGVVEDVSDYITDETGFCCRGFAISA